MKFFIKQYSTKPYIEIPINNILEKYNLETIDIESAVATFSLYNKNTHTYIIANKSAEIFSKERIVSINDEYDYFLRYKLLKENTNEWGEFIGEFKIDFLDGNCGTLTVPEIEKLMVFIIKSITKTTIKNNI